MTYWINRQNKKHTALFRNRDGLYMNESLNWLDVLFLKQQEHLNSKANKISSRRSKSQNRDLLNDFMNTNTFKSSIVEEVIEMMENE